MMLRRSGFRLCAAVGGGNFESLLKNKEKKETLLDEIHRQRKEPQKKPVAAEAGLHFMDRRVHNIESEVGKMSQEEVHLAVVRRLQYQSRYRGMVEMDLILGSFAKAKLEALSMQQLQQYDQILRQFDNDLFKWLVMNEEPPKDIGETDVWKQVVEFAEKNKPELLANMH